MGLRANPTCRQRRFGAEVRKLREGMGLTVAQGAARMGMQASHISNVESGRTGLSAERVRALAGAASGESSTLVDALVELGQDSGKGWWSKYRHDLRPSLMDLAELEERATRIVSYEPAFVPGLLQTPEYATTMYRGGYTSASREEQDLEVEFRVRRQQVLGGERPPTFHAVIHEAALHATLGDRQVMRGQLLRLIEASRLPNVTIQVLPFDGPVPFGTSFTLLEPTVPELSTVVVAHIERSLYLGDDDALARYNDWFARLRDVALPPVDAAAQPEARAVKDSLGLVQRLLYPLL
ncbi:helix-turn-helix transcriptional regulator [Streptomyces sp. ISL-100]|uniref:helix-turn-helix domain-containing protein n=1 Tax=Streptomyces sp. ISL-100 TaxID=2819173 RepID=UPI001BE63C9A|nr:helix-turn-helix transcriptional regulator [Streptomyces sp. ISL-100]MBT2398123.1 helix-turn-helix transcriptional regulator [Streptomyces sp. ISL-100]